MPRGHYKYKAKLPKPEREGRSDAYTSHAPNTYPTASRPTRSNIDWRAPIFQSPNSSETGLSSFLPELDLLQELPLQWAEAEDRQARVSDASKGLKPNNVDLECNGTTSGNVPDEPNRCAPSIDSRALAMHATAEEEMYGSMSETFADLTIEQTQESLSSIFSKDSLSVYSSDSASIFSSASSIYSSGTSIYSFDECRPTRNGSIKLIEEEAETSFGSALPERPLYQQRARTFPARLPPQDAASRERSALAKKAALYKNSRLSPKLPSFTSTLPVWSMVCRAAQASQDCYDSQWLTRRGTYTPANSSKDIKAMIVDDQLIDDSRLVVVSIRGTKFQSLADWAVNKDAKPVKPIGFLDDEDNACHAGFLQVAKAMLSQVATQLRQHPASSEGPSLLFTGHSAGGAVAALMYSHMLSTSVNSDLTTLASNFSSINCITFGSPPLSLTPLPRRDHGAGIFLAFANEGDPVLRLSDAAYLRSLAKLLTATSSVTAAPVVKTVRRSRGTAVIRQTMLAAARPWEELPLWPTPLVPLTNAGDAILLRDKEGGGATASRVTSDDLKEVIFGDFAQHAIEMYIRRVKEMALSATTGRM